MSVINTILEIAELLEKLKDDMTKADEFVAISDIQIQLDKLKEIFDSYGKLI